MSDYSDFIKSNKQIEYLNMPISFDIETSSFYENEEKRAIMYEFTFSINGQIIIGRKWEEFIYILNSISEYYKTHKNRRVIIWVHNLSYEFQFIRKLINWEKVFSLETRKVCYALSDIGIEFRCTYILSGRSLESVGNNLQNYRVSKKVGDLDYTKIRHSKTKLTDKEIGYCINDVQVVCAYIQECIERDGNISLIPLTKTGYVRRYIKKQVIGSGKTKNIKNRRLFKDLTLTVDEYRQLKRAFQGGFTHANPFYSNKIIKNVSSYDFTSSYPYVMLSEKFPMSPAELIELENTEQLEKNLNLYCCLFDVEIYGLESKFMFENYLSESHCYGLKNAVINNGRIVSADHLYTTITEQDFMILQYGYNWESLGIANFRRYKRDYLPKEFVIAILNLYRDKTSLKGVKGYEIDYMLSKEMINSCYGMTVTDISRDEIIYKDGMWDIEQADIEKDIEKYNKSNARFLFYPWGVWITAYARRNLFSGIYNCAEDYIYSDTDSIKIINRDKHINYIDKYDSMVHDKLYAAMLHHSLDIELTAPETKEGIKKPIGVWDYEGTYKRFKTLGAKRYLVEFETNNKVPEYMLTVSGLSKTNAIDYLTGYAPAKKDPFMYFNEDMYIPKGYTGKMTHTYIDDEITGTVIDYTGLESEYSELSSVHLEDADYSLSLSYAYRQFLYSIEEGVF